MTFVALLRAINVSGQNRVPMADLRRLLEGLGLRDVRTYLQSGNVVFDAGAVTGGGATDRASNGACNGASSCASNGASAAAHTARELATVIAARIERDLGPSVGVLVMSAGALAEVAGANPFLGGAGTGERGVDEKWLHATFLFGSAGEADFGKLTLPAAGGEEAAFVGAPPLTTPVVYLKLPHGYGRTKLSNGWFERKLGTAATTRNWRTVQALARMANDED